MKGIRTGGQNQSSKMAFLKDNDFSIPFSKAAHILVEISQLAVTFSTDDFGYGYGYV